ncbi:hypothetical protein HPB50_000468 [Hyalomma asiaticum]|uniref:Uncharacterized protein n=1 Tax=Hyalomma asiaticum TaxID=266040 RepID=A0ACB7T2X2_HYAAI|nr:hypothetical protein HPB50_000468 [Hyalomma asiaticum]
MLPPESLFMNDRKPYELAALQPCIIVSTPLTSATETSQDEASMDSNSRIPGGTAVVLETQNRKSTSANESRKSHGRPLLFKDCLRPKNEKKLKCKLCPSAFSQHESLKKHRELHLRGVEMFHCHKCNKMYLKEEGLLAHLRWHTIGKPYACNLCPAKFAKKAHREAHILRHKGEKPYKCSECERRFTEACDRRSHMRRMHHTGNLKSALDMSGNRQTSSTETSRNEAVRDSEPGISHNTCSALRQSMSAYYQKQAHSFISLGCRQLYRVMPIMLLLSVEASGAPHQRTHTKEAVHYVCELCPSKFFRKGNLESHKLLHESEMNVHKCPDCSSLFKSSTILEEHQKQHNSEKRRYLCHRCPSSFTVKSQLDSHVLIHAQDNQKPHACPVCKKCFSWWPSLISHMGQEHGGVENNVAGAENSA